MTARNAVVSLVVALVVVSVLVPAAAWSAGAQTQQQQNGGQQQDGGLIVESIDAPGAVTPNSTATVNATISNPTSQEVTEEVRYRLAGVGQNVVESQSVTVGPGETTTVNFTLDTTNFETGDYIIGVTTAGSSQFARLDVTYDAEVSFGEQETNGTQVTVNSVFVPEGGYVTIHDQRLLEGDATGSVVGVSSYLEPGFHENVTVTLFDVPGAQFQNQRLTESQLLIAMPHRETNNNTNYDFVSSNGAADGPYIDDGEPVTSNAPVTVANGTDAGGNGTDTPGTTETGTDGGATEAAAGATETETGSPSLAGDLLR